MNKIKSIEKKILNSKCKISKNFLYYMIVPILILLVGVILISTVGFKLGTDFTGSSSVKIYVNKEAVLQNAESYDLNKEKDYNLVYNKVKAVFEENNLKIVSYRTSTINLMNYNEPDGQAVEVVFQNNSIEKEKIEIENQEIRNDLLVEFDYSSYEDAITSVDFSNGQPSFGWGVGILAAVVFGLLGAVIYFMFRFDKSAWIVLILQAALDILLFISLLSIFRLTVNFTIGIAALSTFILTIMNAFGFYSKMKENLTSGKLANANNYDKADATIKETLLKKILLYVVCLVLLFVLSIIAVEAVREVALGLVISFIISFFTSTFFTPAVWSVVHKDKVKK